VDFGNTGGGEENRLKRCLKGGGWIRRSVTKVYLPQGEGGCHELHKKGNAPTKQKIIFWDHLNVEKINTWVHNNNIRLWSLPPMTKTRVIGQTPLS
jgi:hypothetical protein